MDLALWFLPCSKSPVHWSCPWLLQQYQMVIKILDSHFLYLSCGGLVTNSLQTGNHPVDHTFSSTVLKNEL